MIKKYYPRGYIPVAVPATTKLNKYTVVFVWDEDQQVSVAHVTAATALDAEERVYADTRIEGEYENNADVPFLVVSVFEGHLTDELAKERNR